MRRALLPLVALAWPMAAAHAAVTTHDVTVDDNEYRPAEVTINVGDSVRWRNVGLTRHSVTFRSGTSSELLPTQTAVQRFDNPGTYLYFCRDHEDEMKGTVLVRGTAGSTNRSTTITTEPPAGSARTGAPEESTTTTSSTTTTVADDGGTTTTMSEGSAARRPSGVDSDSDGGPNVDAPRQSPPCSSWPQAGPRS